jgi:hypothetical protein
MSQESFDPRTLANMEVALERVCEGRRAALSSVQGKGQTTIGALTEAGEAALARWAISDKKQA